MSGWTRNPVMPAGGQRGGPDTLQLDWDMPNAAFPKKRLQELMPRSRRSPGRPGS